MKDNPFIRDTFYAPRFDYQWIGPGKVDETRHFFQMPLGMTLDGEPRTFLYTNQYLAGQFPRGNSFYVTGIRILCVPDGDPADCAEDYFAIMTSGLLKLIIENREWVNDGPLAKFPTCFAIPQRFDKPEETKLWRRIRHWTKLYKEIYYGITPLFIDADQWFGVNIRLEKLKLRTRVKFGVILDGLIVRQAQ